jgi:hypothetical protein
MLKSLIESIREAIVTPWLNKPSEKTLKEIEKRLRDLGMTSKKYKAGDPSASLGRIDPQQVPEKPTTKSYTWRDAGSDKKFGS